MHPVRKVQTATHFKKVCFFVNVDQTLIKHWEYNQTLFVKHFRFALEAMFRRLATMQNI